ncbi:PQQ-dependent sugar dehydrogenase [Antarcticibacterium sp. 1MA-6-2]|uniref:PQQ-dependent sugar dehydrogenase n=1 Tax=Antarcticibacterium sp. 1MA-6-2 TaxID=2908210 RepID=UPI001F2EC4B5|nr:PQQ-dependent sugar dehydrogenase [Antarcticibacterium sp. 1MA-6-2]UJH92553.1 PQQ-dependent sugar dehydrogenase [Antarcticibacterium sp. 1MA-6-2]
MGGILWAAGEEDLDYTKATTIRVPEETHFHQVVLAEDLDEPTELAVINNGDVLIVERKGEIKIFKASNGTTKLAGKLEVHSEEEDGLMGVAVDPDFQNNKWVYLYYSPAGAELVNVLSRFVLKEDLIDMSSEKRIIEVPVQREECCHT